MHDQTALTASGLICGSVGVLADAGVTYNSSQTYQHLVAHNPDVRLYFPPYTRPHAPVTRTRRKHDSSQQS